jgi:hypothetical protein
LSPSLSPASDSSESADVVVPPNTDGFMEWQQAPELAEVINAWFNLPRPIVAGILALIRATKAPQRDI